MLYLGIIIGAVGVFAFSIIAAGIMQIVEYRKECKKIEYEPNRPDWPEMEEEYKRQNGLR